MFISGDHVRKINYSLILSSQPDLKVLCLPKTRSILFELTSKLHGRVEFKGFKASLDCLKSTGVGLTSSSSAEDQLVSDMRKKNGSSSGDGD